mmetsp:Transcript_14676/g.27581  ORF Transcript_14676/g.27581 Transcript_14676/m.27581 type:complete len:98 (-) Transcript_14676:625-918(-)
MPCPIHFETGHDLSQEDERKTPCTQKGWMAKSIACTGEDAVFPCVGSAVACLWVEWDNQNLSLPAPSCWLVELLKYKRRMLIDSSSRGQWRDKESES